MKGGSGKIIVFAICALVSVASVSIGTSLALYFAADSINQTVGYSGARKQSIYLDLQAWKVEDNKLSSPANYYIYMFNNTTHASTWASPTDTVTSLNNITISGTGGSSGRYLKLFLFDDSKYEGFNFVRIKDTAVAPSWGDAWNQTRGITYSSSYNYYCITNVGGDSEYAIERSSYTPNMIYENNGVLTFDNPAV